MSKRPAVPFARRLDEAQRLHDRGNPAEAARRYAELDQERPDNPVVLHVWGVALAQTGRMAEAEEKLLRAVQRDPRDPKIRFDLAALRDAQGRVDEAEAILRELVTQIPDDARAWAGIASFRRHAGDLAGTAAALAQAYRAEPTNLDYALGAAELLSPDEGAAILAECLERSPGEASLLLPLADLLIRAENMAEAEQILRILISRRPKEPLPWTRLGQVLARLSRFPDAAAALYESILRDPDDPEAWQLLSNVREAMGDAEGSVAAIDRALTIDPENLVLATLRARVLGHVGRTAAALAGLAELPPSIRATADVRLMSAMLLPPILESNEQIDALRERWMAEMADVEANPTFIPTPWKTVSQTGYFLGYHGREDRPLMEAFARASLAASPHLDYEAPDLSGSGEAKLRVGFLSAHMRMHSVGRVLIKLMGALDRERFDVVLLQLPDKSDGGQEWGEANADRTVKLDFDLDDARAAIEAQRLDVLIFCDLHLTPFVDALSHGRLAPVQATTWGHPGTGGRPTIDYWISCEDWELPGNERLYTERLVRLKHPPFVYT